MKKNKILFLFLIALCLMTAGCENENRRIVDLNLHYVPTDTTPLNLVDRNAQAQLAEAATSVGHSLQQVSAMEMAKNPNIHLRPPLNAHRIGMAMEVSVDWNGPARPLLDKLAKLSHYRLHVLGPRPAVPPMVFLTAKYRTLYDILRSVTFQVQSKAQVFVYPSKRTIELRYYT